MTTQNPKNQSLVDFLTSLVKTKPKDDPQTQKLSTGLADLAIAVHTLATEFTTLAKSVASLAKIAHDHSLEINDIITVQAYILKKIDDKGTDSTVALPDVEPKSKTNKSN